MEIKHINKPQLNLDSLYGGIQEKAFQEGVYADTPANRKLGRVGMSYKQVKEMLEKGKEKVSNAIRKITKKEPKGKEIGKELERLQKAQKSSVDKLNKLKWTVKKSDQFKTRNGHPATDRIEISIERAEGGYENDHDFKNMTNNVYIKTPKGKVYHIGNEGGIERYAIPNPEYKGGKDKYDIQYANVDAKAAAEFLDGKDYYEVKSGSYKRGVNYDKLTKAWHEYLSSDKK